MATQPERKFTANDAKREHVPLLIGLTGPSGGGKTYSALRLATGIQQVTGGDIYFHRHREPPSPALRGPVQVQARRAEGAVRLARLSGGAAILREAGREDRGRGQHEPRA
jgi:hypothetical protein